MANVTKKCTATNYLLTLNAEEAQVLLAILQMIGGVPDRYPRLVVTNIAEALKEADVEPALLATERGRDSIIFAAR